MWRHCLLSYTRAVSMAEQLGSFAPRCFGLNPARWWKESSKLYRTSVTLIRGAFVWRSSSTSKRLKSRHMTFTVFVLLKTKQNKTNYYGFVIYRLIKYFREWPFTNVIYSNVVVNQWFLRRYMYIIIWGLLLFKVCKPLNNARGFQLIMKHFKTSNILLLT